MTCPCRATVMCSAYSGGGITGSTRRAVCPPFPPSNSVGVISLPFSNFQSFPDTTSRSRLIWDNKSMRPGVCALGLVRGVDCEAAFGGVLKPPTGANQAEPNVRVRVVKRLEATRRGSADGCLIAPRTAPDAAFGSGGRPPRIGLSRRAVGRLEPIRAPFPCIAVHVVQAPGIG